MYSKKTITHFWSGNAGNTNKSLIAPLTMLRNWKTVLRLESAPKISIHELFQVINDSLICKMLSSLKVLVLGNFIQLLCKYQENCNYLKAT